MYIMKNIEDKKFVVKSNHLIEASYKLSLQEVRLIFLLSSMIKANDKDFFSYKINIENLKVFLGLKDKNFHTKIKNITKDLLGKVLILPDFDAKTELQIAWLSSAKYYNKEGIVELCFNPELKSYLLQLKNKFTQYELQNILNLKSFYSIRIYELLKQYEKIGERLLNLDELKKILGIDKNKYNKYNNFKKKVLLTAQNELEQKTDLAFEFEEQKTNRSISAILFRIIKRIKNKTPATTDENKKIFIPSEVHERLTEYFCLTDNQALEILAMFGKDHSKIMSILNEIEKKRKTIKQIGAYTYKAFKDGFKFQSKFSNDDKQEKEKKEKEKYSEELLQTKYNTYLAKSIENIKKTLPEDTLKAKYEQAKQSLKNQNKRFGNLISLIEIELDKTIAKENNILPFDKWKTTQSITTGSQRSLTMLLNQ